MTAIVGVNQDVAGPEQTDPAVRTQILAAMDAWGAQSIRIRYPWARIEPTQGAFDWAELDTFVNEVTASGLTVLLMVHWAPEWSSGTTEPNGIPGDPVDYGTVLGTAADRYGAALAGIEMWDKPNLQESWGGTPTQYVDLLAAAFPRARDLAPVMTYITGGTMYYGLYDDWFATVYADARFRPGSTHDAVAIQPYVYPADSSPDAPSSSRTLLAIGDLQTLRAPYDDSPLWATEFGWSTHANTGSEPEESLGINEIQQAEFVPRAYEIMINQFGVVAAYVHTAIDTTTPYVAPLDAPATVPVIHQDHYGLLPVDLGADPKPVVQALTDVFGTRFIPPEPPPPDVADLEDRVTVLEQTVDALSTQVDTLTVRVEALESAASP